MSEECIFCAIANRRIPAKIVYEDENSVAFLDINPRSKGMCIVVPKLHFNSFEENREMASRIFDKAMIVGEKIKKALNPITIFFSIIQTQIPHFHIRIYPVFKDQIPLIENKSLQITPEELDQIAARIRTIIVDWKGRKEIERVVEEKPKLEEKPVVKKDDDDIFWVKRSQQMA